jgi:hypothetical protein
MADEVVHQVLGCVAGEALQELGEVFLSVEVVAAFGRVMEISGGFLQCFERRQELRGLAQRRDEALNHFLAREALHRIDCGGKAGGEQQRADLGGGLLASLEVDDLGVGRGLCIPEILGDDIAHTRDLGELVADVGDREVEVLGTDEEHVVGLTLPDGFEQMGDELDEAAGLLEPLVPFEEGDDVFQAGMEGIRRGDFVGNGPAPRLATFDLHASSSLRP